MLQASADGVVLLAVEHPEHRFEIGIQVAVVIGIQLISAGLSGSCEQQGERGEAKQGRLVHGRGSVLISVGVQLG
ncbi:hypothetical protein D3C84_1196940 [compost metagenome]